MKVPSLAHLLSKLNFKLAWPSRIAHRLALGYGLVFFLMLATAVAVAINGASLARRIHQVFEVDNTKADAVVDMMRSLNAAALSMRNLSVINNPSDLGDEYKRLAQHLAQYDHDSGAVAELMKRLGATPPEERAVGAVKAAEASAREIVRLARTSASSSEPDDLAIGIRTELRHDLAKWNAAQQDWIDSVVSLRDLEKSISRQSYDAMTANLARAKLQLLALAMLAFAVGVGSAWKTTRDITRPLARAVEASARIAGGQLDVAIEATGDGEPRQLLVALEKMRLSLHSLASKVRGASDHIGTSSAEIAAANMNLSERTAQAAASLQFTASSIGRLERGIAESADAAVLAVNMSTRASDESTRARDATLQGVARMDEILAQSARIGEIVAAIDAVAFQSNILALNASVEAARAGERGRGFAIVAAEVRALANRSANAGKEISTIIEQLEVRIRDGATLVRHAGEAMRAVFETVHHVHVAVEGISERTVAQRENIVGINGTMQVLDRSTQQNAAMVEEAASAAAALSQQSQSLTTIVSSFRLGQEGADCL